MNQLTTTNATLRQTMLSFAYLAYTGEGITSANPEDTMKAAITAALPKIQISSANNATLANWEIAWGPVAYTVPGSLYQDNMMYVVKQTDTPVGSPANYVIATRGTNFGSQVDWFLEDFEVINTMPWPMQGPIPGAISSASSDAVISESTSIGMTIQLDRTLMADSCGIGLIDFLKTITTEKINICVTGHSLGGVLSNTLALYLLENPRFWDHSGSSTVSCICFAAPTAGNGPFASNANTVFQQSFTKGTFPGWDPSLNTNLDNVMCNMDLVPMTCISSNLCTVVTTPEPFPTPDKTVATAGPIFSLYSNTTGINPTDNINFGNLIFPATTEWGVFQSLVLAPLSEMMNHDYTQLDPNGSFQGEFIGNTLTFETDAGLSDYLKAFAAQAGWQHSNSYPIYLNVPMLFDPTIVVRDESESILVPSITSIDPSSSDSDSSLGISVVITGTGFSSDLYGNFIVFSDPTNPISYRMVDVSDDQTQLALVFYMAGTSDGVQNISVAKTSPYYQSQPVSFTIS